MSLIDDYKPNQFELSMGKKYSNTDDFFRSSFEHDFEGAQTNEANSVGSSLSLEFWDFDFGEGLTQTPTAPPTQAPVPRSAMRSGGSVASATRSMNNSISFATSVRVIGGDDSVTELPVSTQHRPLHQSQRASTVPAVIEESECPTGETSLRYVS